jgi:amino acid transporter
MNQPKLTPAPAAVTRRSFLQTSSKALAAGALAGALPVERFALGASPGDTLRIALVGCGGRGSGAADQALSTSGGVKLVAMADVFKDRMDDSLKNLKNQHKDKIEVNDDSKFIGFDAYKKAIAMADVVILATPRIFFAMARDGVFLQAAARVHPRFGSPHISVIIMGVWAIALLLITGGEIGALLSGVVFADWIFFGLGAASVFALRRSRPDAPRPYRAWGYPIVPGFFVVAAIIGIVSAYVSSLRTSLLGTAILVVGVVVYYLTKRRALARGIMV